MLARTKRDHQVSQAAAVSRQDRLRGLLFTGAALGTTLVTLAAADPKIPPFVGE